MVTHTARPADGGPAAGESSFIVEQTKPSKTSEPVSAKTVGVATTRAKIHLKKLWKIFVKMITNRSEHNQEAGSDSKEFYGE